MNPSAINSDYPKFVPNQVLTSDNLNDLFDYLDEQQRITRANLTGTGIICGLGIKTSPDPEGISLTLKKGCGITSMGYLVTFPEVKYHYYNKFDAVKCQFYEPFVNKTDKTQKILLWELKQKGDSESGDNPFHPLNDPSGFLNNKAVLLFAELLETGNKNCDPNSCDDKGMTVTGMSRPLLILKSDVPLLMQANSDQSIQKAALKLREVRLPRFDIGSTLLLDSEDVFRAYLKIMNKSFLRSVQTALSDSWSKLYNLIKNDFPTDPFANLIERSAFLSDGSLASSGLLQLQYYYDFISDLLAAYSELKTKAQESTCICLPDENSFPRHLLLGEASSSGEMHSDLRTPFTGSPVLCNQTGDANHLITLFRRLVLMYNNFSLTGDEREFFIKKGFIIKITPSLLGREPLSEKSIPFYYNTNKGNNPLFENWNYSKKRIGNPHQILSYKSFEYNNEDDFVQYPLKYDIEPYNFLRVEGHVGHDYKKVLSELENQKKYHRLPIDVVALGSDTRSIFKVAGALSKMNTGGTLRDGFELMVKNTACFADLFLALDEWLVKLRCCLKESKRYFSKLPSPESKSYAVVARGVTPAGTPASEPAAEAELTIGKLYEEKIKGGTMVEEFSGAVFSDIAAGKAHTGTALVIMPYKIDGMISILPEHITELDPDLLESRYEDLKNTSAKLIGLYGVKAITDTMAGIDMPRLSNNLEMSCLVCLLAELKLLISEFLIRLLGLMIRQKLGFFAYTNPGIQHKAGVTPGGTLILVFHEEPMIKKAETRKELNAVLKKVNLKKGNASATVFSGSQSLISSVLLTEEVAFLQKVLAEDEDQDEISDKLVSEINPGTVIADFYVPYLFRSTCPPAQAIFLNEHDTPNMPPVAKTGDAIYIKLPVNSATLDGSSSTDPDGTISAFRWEKESGPAAGTILDPDKPVTVVSGLSEGAYVFKLTVTDNTGATNSASLQITVMQQSNSAPKAVAATDKSTLNLPDNTATLNGRDSVDPDQNAVLTYSWTLEAGQSGAILQSPDQASTKVTFSKSGLFTFMLTVKDEKGATGTDKVAVLVNEALNHPPVADAGPAQAVTLTAINNFVTLDGSKSSDPDGGQLKFRWVFSGGPSQPQLLTPDKPVTKVTGLVTGIYTFRLNVQDEAGAASADTVVIQVKTDEIPEKKCTALATLISAFETWKPVAERKPVFRRIFESYAEISEYMNQLSQVQNEPAEGQISYFASGYRAVAIQEIMVKWLKQLQSVIETNKDLRLIALMLYRVIYLLVLHIVCIQTTDFDRGKVPMKEVFEPIDGHINLWINMISQGQFTNEEISAVKLMGIDTGSEIKQVEKNGEIAAKKLYVKTISRISALLNAIA